MNKPVLGGSIVLALVIVAVGILADISMFIWLPALLVVFVFGFGATRTPTGGRPDTREP